MASVHWHQLNLRHRVLRKRKNSFIIALTGKGGHGRLVPQNYVLTWEATARGFIGLAQKTGLLIKVPVLFFIRRSFWSRPGWRQGVWSWFLVVLEVIIPCPSLWNEDCLQGRGVKEGFNYKRKHEVRCNFNWKVTISKRKQLRKEEIIWEKPDTSVQHNLTRK